MNDNLLLYFLIGVISLPLAYYYILMLAGGFQNFYIYKKGSVAFYPRNRFLIAIPAHNEEGVIDKSLDSLERLDYPKDLYDVAVVADHCDDATYFLARKRGVKTLDRKNGPTGNKSQALADLFHRFLDDSYDAVVIFDADTLVHKEFLSRMNDRLCLGENVIQGNHKVYNYRSGGFAALSEAAFIINNLFENAGRNALGLSAKLRGDSVCMRRSIVEQFGFGNGLAEDQYVRHVLIRNGYKVVFEPFAIGWGQAPISWHSAKMQRFRWFQGNMDCNRDHFKKNILNFFNSPNLVRLDNLLETIFPKYTSYAFIFVVIVCMLHALDLIYPFDDEFLKSSVLLLLFLVISFPFLCLFFSRVPLRVYINLFFGPYYIFWRFTVLVKLLFSRGNVRWVRTQREIS